MIRLAAAALLVLVPWSAAWAKSLSSPPPSVTSPAAKSLADSSVMPLDAVLVLIEGEPITSAQVLARAAGFVQREVAPMLRTRTMPRIKFVHDDGIEGAMRIDSILQELREERSSIEDLLKAK